MNETLYLAHHGIKGQKWGVRRYQNEDGTLTSEGEKRYRNDDGSLNSTGRRELRKNVRRINKLNRKYDKAYKKSRAYWLNNIANNQPSERQAFQFVKLRSDEYAIQKQYTDYFKKSMSSLKGSDYYIGYDFVNNYYKATKTDKPSSGESVDFEDNRFNR